MRFSLPVAALLLLSPALAAVEDREADLRLTIGMMPGIEEVDVSDVVSGGTPVPSASGSFELDPSFGPWFDASIMFRSDRVDGLGLVGGPFAYFGWSKGERQNSLVSFERKLTQYGVGGMIGPSLQFDWLRLELLPFAGIGLARSTSTITSGSTTDMHNSEPGWGYTYGARAGIYVDGFQGLVGLQAGWQAFSASVDFTEGPAGQAADSETITGAGVFAAVVFGVAF